MANGCQAAQHSNLFLKEQSDVLQRVVTRLGATPMSVALAWLLRRSPNALLIPGTSSAQHLRENIIGAGRGLPADAVAEVRICFPLLAQEPSGVAYPAVGAPVSTDIGFGSSGLDRAHARVVSSATEAPSARAATMRSTSNDGPTESASNSGPCM